MEQKNIWMDRQNRRQKTDTVLFHQRLPNDYQHKPTRTVIILLSNYLRKKSCTYFEMYYILNVISFEGRKLEWKNMRPHKIKLKQHSDIQSNAAQL